MKPIVILYATREGHTRRIAEHIEARIRAGGQATTLCDVRDLREQRADTPPFDGRAYESAIVAASVHKGKHEPEMVAFVKRHRDELEAIHSSFVSVSLSEAGAEDPKQPPEHRTQAAAQARSAIDAFLQEAGGWRPEHVKPVAGALPYTKYNLFLRLVMKHIAKKTSLTTDTSRDHDFTDWAALDVFVDELLGEDARRAPRTQGTPATP